MPFLLLYALAAGFTLVFSLEISVESNVPTADQQYTFRWTRNSPSDPKTFTLVCIAPVGTNESQFVDAYLSTGTVSVHFKDLHGVYHLQAIGPDQRILEDMPVTFETATSAVQSTTTTTSETTTKSATVTGDSGEAPDSETTTTTKPSSASTLLTAAETGSKSETSSQTYISSLPASRSSTGGSSATYIQPDEVGSTIILPLLASPTTDTQPTVSLDSNVLSATKTSHTPVIAGAVVAALLVVLAAGFLIFLRRRRIQRSRRITFHRDMMVRGAGPPSDTPFSSNSFNNLAAPASYMEMSESHSAIQGNSFRDSVTESPTRDNGRDSHYNGPIAL
ncbi:hypothetical protein C8J56DRAFT_949517 [Mycena floridula]|nr:hypothetical protein C8J56DRAFT_949517 [Mycena floridula]